jgi:hypothetical protein
VRSASIPSRLSRLINGSGRKVMERLWGCSLASSQ